MKTFCLHERKIEERLSECLSILILNKTRLILPISLLNKPVPRTLEVLRDEFVARYKIFVGKIDTNLARWRTFIR